MSATALVVIGYVAGAATCVVAMLFGQRLRERQPMSVEELQDLYNEVGTLLRESERLEELHGYGVGSVAHPFHEQQGGSDR